MKYSRMIEIVTRFKAYFEGGQAAALSKNTPYSIIGTHWHLRERMRLLLLQFLREQPLLLTEFLVHQQKVCIKNNLFQVI